MARRPPPIPTKRPASDDDAVPIAELLRELGYATPAAQRQARAALEAAGLTNPRKQAIAASKRDRAVRALASALVRVCGDACFALARSSTIEKRTPVIAGRAGCEICGGSNNRRAALACVRALAENGITNVLIVGGATTLHHEINELFAEARASVKGRAAAALHIELIDGTKSSHTLKDAIPHMNRAQLVVIWANTELRHAVSNHYTDNAPKGLRMITVARRSIEALCTEMTRSYAMSPERRPRR